MEKTLCIILIFVLYGCSNDKTYACSKIIDNSQILLTFNTVNDNISELIIDEKYEIDSQLLSHGESFFAYLDSLDDSYTYLDGWLYRKQVIIPDDVYSISLTLQSLRKDRYYCD